MRILLTGATGFIGSALADHLRQRGHSLCLAVRRPSEAVARWPDAEALAIDFNNALHPDQWRDAVEGIDAVINAVGIIRESREQRFQSLHADAPIALFEAATRAGVGRIIQISALGADADAVSAYHLSKREADEYLLRLQPHVAIIQPSLVFGRGGGSAMQFLSMAALPIIPLPGTGQQRIQPIHIDDLCEGVASLLQLAGGPRRVAAVGPECLSLREYVGLLRASLEVGRARWLHVPMVLVRLFARLGDHLPVLALDSDRLAMLQRGNCADAAAMTALLGHTPRSADQFVRTADAPELLKMAHWKVGLAMLRASIALVWLVSGTVSLGLWPVEDSLLLLARCGLHGVPALVALYGAALLDIGLGLGTLALGGRWLRHCYLAQIVLIVLYSSAIGIFLPELLLHPFAPIVKNVPMLAVLVLLRWNVRA